MKSKIHHASSISEAVNDLETFFEADMWYAKEAEWKNEKAMIKYLRIHFDVLKEEIIKLIGKRKFQEKTQ